MNNLLIPFGLNRSTNTIVEPEDSDRGRACNCICPGCYAPLLSRHPKEHRIHFAHDSKHPEAKPEGDCPFSSAVAVAMMARELADSLTGKKFSIPEYVSCHHFECCGETEDTSVTKQKILTITSACKRPTCGGQVFDLELSFGKAKILIDLFYKGKPKQFVLNEKAFAKEKSGVLAIGCDTFDIGSLAKDRNLRFSDTVLDFLLETGFREWCFHPRQITLADRVKSSHQCRPSYKPLNDPVSIDEDNISGFEFEYRVEIPVESTGPTHPYEPKKYQCVMCKNEWLQKETGAPICPRCNTHLFSIGV